MIAQQVEPLYYSVVESKIHSSNMIVARVVVVL